LVQIVCFMKEPIILLTACINPEGAENTVLQDCEERLKQYKLALDWYLQNTTNKITFVENSGYDISPLYRNQIEKGRLEVMTFQGNDYDKSRGKGYGEALIIEYAFNNSKFINETSQIVKVTGRLIISNIKTLMKTSGRYQTVYIARQKIAPIGIMSISYFFIAPSKFFTDFFLHKLNLIDDSKPYYFEMLLMDEICNWERKGGKWREFWLPIQVYGISGSTGLSYNHGLMNYIKALVKFFYHKLPFYE